MQWRSTTLLQGAKNLLNDQSFSGLARSIYNHALVNPQDAGTAETEKALKHPPAYMDPRLFADALVDVAKVTQDSPDKMKSTIDANIKDPQLNSLMKGIVDQTAGDLGKMREQLAAWFNNSMDRVSGAYKRKTQLWSFVIALVMVIALNVSAISVGEALWLQPMLAKSIGPTTTLDPAATLKVLQKLDFPIGWSCGTQQFEESERTRDVGRLAYHCGGDSIWCSVLVRSTRAIRSPQREWSQSGGEAIRRRSR